MPSEDAPSEAGGKAGCDSFALIYSYERYKQPSGEDGRIGIQVMGPGDGYIAQTSTDLRTFWGARNDLALGACLEPTPSSRHDQFPKGMLPTAKFDDVVKYGFQASATRHQGKIRDAPGTAPSNIPASVSSVEWEFNVRPVYGWGDAGGLQRSTASWLAALPLFEPHWQILMAHGLASGMITWGDRKIVFKDCPCYAEKNWGQGFPDKWAWVQCNSFKKSPHLAVTAVGAYRGLFGSDQLKETVGLIGIHYEGRFLDLQCFNGPMKWEVAPWGKWCFWAKNNEFEALVEASCSSDAGSILRAPSGKEGLAAVCKDTFAGRVRLRVWRLSLTGIRSGEPVIDDESTSAALEVGGGPWWDTWRATAESNPAIQAAVRLPLESTFKTLGDLLPFKAPTGLTPPGY